MRIVRWIGRELAGAYRSVRYDWVRRHSLARRPTEVLYPEYDAYERPPRRWYAATGLGLVVAAGVAATYVAVNGGLGALLTPIVHAVPGIDEAVPQRGPATVTTSAQPAGPERAAHRAATPPAQHPSGAAAPAADAAAPEAPTPAPVARPSCLCPVLPVPTPQSPSPTPSDRPSPSPSPSVSRSPSAPASGSPAAQP